MCAFQNFNLLKHSRTLLTSQTWQSLVPPQIWQIILFSLLVVNRVICNGIILSDPGNIHPGTNYSFAEAALRLYMPQYCVVFVIFRFWLSFSKRLKSDRYILCLREFKQQCFGSQMIQPLMDSAHVWFFFFFFTCIQIDLML